MGFFDFLFRRRASQHNAHREQSALDYFARGNAKAQRGDLLGAMTDFSEAITSRPGVRARLGTPRLRPEHDRGSRRRNR